MKNTIIRYGIAALLILGVVSCAEEIPETPDVLEEGVTLTLRSASPQTRTMPGVDDLNENKINSLHYFFYPVDKNNPTDDPTANSQPQYWGHFSNLNANGEYILRINLTEYMLNYEVFPRPYNTCQVYIIANLPEDIVIGDDTDKSLAALRQIVLNGDFVSSQTQEYFVMEGLGEAQIIDRKNIIAATGTINLDRVASKISVAVDVAESYTAADTKVWYPEPESMTIELVNGISRTVLGGTPVVPTEEDYFRTTIGLDGSAILARKFTENTDGNWEAAPFYSYPAAWNVGDENEPYLRIMLPWKNIINTEVGGQQRPVEQFENCYYKLILSGTEMARNTWYDQIVKIGVLGSFEEQEETILSVTECTYYVADWTTGLEIEANIEGGRYLVVDRLKYEVYNENTFEIPFTTSHNCEIVDMSLSRLNQATVTYPDYSDDTPNENATVAWNNTDWSIKIENNVIKFSHELRNDLSAGKGNYDFAPYTIKFRIRHVGDEYNDIYYKDITIVQYPAMLIECNPNRKVNDKGGVAVNGSTSSSTNYDWNEAHGLTGGNKNPNMYVIKTTVLPSSSSYVLGDPRSLEVNNLTGWNPAIITAPGIENLNSTRKLSNYYPTQTTDASRSIIAPKFRIASSYGVTNELSYTEAQYRCASYQEDGYPAGRWRLPTQSEIAFIVQLSADGVIPELFSAGSAYWCAGGRVTPNTGGGVTISTNTGNNTGPVRCVYDEWYWENTAYPRMPGTNVTFTWGDAAR